MRIYAVDPHRRWLEVRKEVLSLMDGALMNQKSHGGEYCQRVEAQLREFTGRKHALLVKSGTDANIMMLLSQSIGQGNEVIVTPYVCPAGVVPIKLLGSQPVFVDINRYGSLAIDQIEAKITNRTKAIFGVGLFGDMYDFDAAQALCKKYGLVHFNDACQSILGKYKSQESSALGDLASMSFGRNKNIPIPVTYGAVLTNDDEAAHKIRATRFVGQRHRNTGLETLGINAEPGEDSAVQCYVTMKYFQKWQTRRLERAQQYYELLRQYEIPMRLSPAYSVSSVHKLVVFVQDKIKASELMGQRGIDCPQHYRHNLALSSVLAQKPQPAADFPMTQKYINYALSLPLTAWTTEEEVQIVVDNLVEVLDKYNLRFTGSI